MKRQASISSFFTKKSTEKKFKAMTPTESSVGSSPELLEGPSTIEEPSTVTESSISVEASMTAPRTNTTLSQDNIKDLHVQFQKKFGALDQERLEKRKHVDTVMTNPTAQKFTPLEAQVVDLKAKYPDCLLLIEVGYKFRFFGEDALIASRVLRIAHFIDRNFDVASFPVHRLDVHVNRLVNAGHKVGIVRQTETAALKAVGSNRGAPFERKLTQLITKGTMVDAMITDNEKDSSYLMCLVEEKQGGNGPDDRVYTGMMAVQLSTGHVIYDAFQDTFMRSELETRLLHIEPSEILIADNVTRPTEKLVSHLNTFGEVRIERMDNMFSNDYNSALTYVSDFYASTSLLPTIVELPDIIIKTLACLIRYLDEFKLSSILKNTTFSHFISESHMLLNANTLVNLEIYKNSTNGKEQGSLFSILNHTSTKFGQRLLRRWVGRPLLNVERLNQRIDAVEEIISTELVQKNRLVTLLKKLPDIEKGLCRIHYGKASPKELVEVLNAFHKISSSFSSNEPRFKSDLLNTLLDILPTIHTDVQEYLEAIHPDVENKADFFRSEAQWPEIPKQKNNIKYIEALLQDHLTELKQSTGISNLKYVTVAGIEYLIEVPSKVKVPNQWLKISNTKLVSRYHDKYILQQLKERDQHRELLSMEAEKSYTQFLVDISAKYQDFRQVVSSLAQLDCLLSLAVTSSQSNYCKPIFASTIDVKDSRHPIIERKESNYVPNDIQFTETQRAMVLTGPNMGGKSSYVRQIASICIMGQLGSYVPAKSARLSILDAVYTRMGASDNMMRGESTFMVELHETSDIMKHATERSLVILDELGRGTSTHDGQAIAYAVLDYFITRIRAMTLFVTHYPCIGQLETEYPHNVRNCYMSYLEQDESNIVFLYKLVDGIAQDSYGMNVARLAHIPPVVIERAKAKSAQIQEQMQQREREIAMMKKLKRVSRE